MQITKAQIIKIHTILNKRGEVDAEQKARLVRQFTGDPERSSTKDLTFNDANMLLRHIGGTALSYENWALFDCQNKQHRAILSLCHQMSWITEYRRVDLVRLSEWLKSKKSPVKKPLKKMTTREVSKIIVALQNMAG